MTLTPISDNIPPALFAGIQSGFVYYRYAPDINSLSGFIAEANDHPADQYVIWLTSASYDVAVTFGYMPLALLGLTGNVIIVHDEAQSPAVINRSGGESYRLFYVAPGGKLLLINVTVSGFGGSTGVGGAIYNRGDVLLYKTTFNNNTAVNGGAVSSLTNLRIWNSMFQGNSVGTIGGGGAVASETYIQVGQVTIQCSTFQSNQAGYGGAISGYSGGQVTVSKSNFITNIGADSSGIYNNPAPADPITAINNWWGDSSGPKTSTNSALGDSIIGNILYDPFATSGLINIQDAVNCPRPAEATIPYIVPADQMDVSTTSLPAPIVPPSVSNEILNHYNNGGDFNAVLITQVPEIGTCQALPQYDPVVTRACGAYAYAAVYHLISSYTGQPPKMWDLLSIVYNEELSTFSDPSAASHMLVSGPYGWPPGQPSSYQDVAFQALARNYFDSTQGACRFVAASNSYDCSYNNIINWLSVIHGVYNEVNPLNNNTQASVEVGTLFGFSDSIGFRKLVEELIRNNPDFHSRMPNSNGMFRYDDDIRKSINANLSIWRTGQGPDVPSNWGNQKLTTGTTTFALSSEEPLGLIVHVYGDKSTSYGTSLRTPGPNCTYIGAITTSAGGFTVSNC